MNTFIELKLFLNTKSLNLNSDLSDLTEIKGLASLKNANSQYISFFHNIKYLPYLENTKAIACFINNKYKKFLPKNCIPIIVKNPYEAFAHSTDFFHMKESLLKNFSTNSSLNNFFLEKNSKIDSKSQFGNFCVINSNVEIKKNVIIKDNSVIGPNVLIDENSIIESGCIISNTKIGKNCIIQSGTVIGDNGFGFTEKNKIEVKHIGNVIIGNNVSIGSNTTIDRATLDSTIIGNDVRIDNLVQIAHNVQIGHNTIIAGQSGIAGSTVIGHNCKLGGQVGIAGHLNIGSNVIIAAKSGVTKNIISNSIVAGFPAINIKKWKKSMIKFYKDL